MKQKTKRVASAVLVILLSTILLHPDLAQVYKKGIIPLKNETPFGAKTDWQGLFYDMGHSIAAAPDGSIFISNDRQHNIFKFSSSGDLQTHFGQKGSGPSDLYFPGKLSILDGKYLVVGEYATTRRISLFHLDGKIFKVLKADHNCFYATSLKDNHIAYISYFQEKETLQETKIWIKDTDTGNENLVKKIELPIHNRLKANDNYTISLGKQNARVHILKNSDGNLLVGVSNTLDLEMYSPEGKFLKSFKLKMEPIAVTPEYIQEFKQDYLDSIKYEKGAQPYINLIKKTSFERAFSKYLPYYRSLMVDSDGNILVFKWMACATKYPKVFQVYSPDGVYKGDVTIVENEYEVNINDYPVNIEFSKSGIYVFVQRKNADDIYPRLIKIAVPR